MRKFSKLLEQLTDKKHFRVSAEIDLTIEAENDGEASYIAESILASSKNQSAYVIRKVVESEKDELVEESTDIYLGKAQREESELDTQQKIQKTWEAEFGERTPTTTEKMEFYHQMREAGFNGEDIFMALQDKMSGDWIQKQNIR